jgi:CMP-N,N'-diacetyllegionaminic acid synthase
VNCMRTLAIIPARGGSKRLPGKNIRPFLGRPLIQWSIEFAKSVDQFSSIFVSTDSDDIANSCKSIGFSVNSRRPQNLASDTASSVDVALDALARAELSEGRFDLVALLQPTTPIREKIRWDQAFDLIKRGAFDAVLGVTQARSHPYQVFKQEANFGLTPWLDRAELHLRSQDLPAAFCVNGGLYLIRSEVLKSERTFFPSRTGGVHFQAPYESMDIDTEADWVVSEALAKHYGKTP